MGNVLVQESSLQAIAGAIRSKTGGSDTYKPREMAPAIQSLPGSGVLQSLNVTENGNFTPPSGVDGFDRVSVAVPGGFGAGDEGKVVLNGALMPQTSLSVTANGTYDTTAKNSVVVSVSGGASLPTGLYVGEGTPDASLGSNGDVYFEYTFIPAYISSNNGGIIITDIGISPSHSIEAVAALTKQSSKWDSIFHAAYSTSSGSGVFSCGFLDSSNAALIFTKSTSHTGSPSQYSSNSYTKSTFLNRFHTVKLAKNQAYVDGTLVHEFAATSDTGICNVLALFAAKDGSSLRSGSDGYAAITEVKVWDPNDTLVARLLPYQSNGVACMRNELSGTIYPVTGKAMNYVEAGYTYVARWVKSGGVWAIKTTS